MAPSASRYAPLEPTYLGRSRRRERLASSEPWIFGRWSRYCPDCLAGDGSAIQRAHGGPWRKLWRLPPVFACTVHRRLLHDLCPACRQPAASLHHTSHPLVASPLIDSLHPAQCRNPTRPGRAGTARPVCGTYLNRRIPPVQIGSDPRAADELLETQQHLLLLLDPLQPDKALSCGQLTTGYRYFTDLRLISTLICITWPAAATLLSGTYADTLDEHVNQRRDRIRRAQRTQRKVQAYALYDRPSSDSLQCAGLLTLADHLLHQDSHEQLQALIPRPAARTWATHYLPAQTHCSPGLRTAAEPAVRIHRPRDRVGRPPQPDTANRFVRPRDHPRPTLLLDHDAVGFTHAHVPAYLPTAA